MSRELTEKEVRNNVLDLIKSDITYWQTLPNKSLQERLEGLAFSILVMLDGGTGLPAFIVAPCPHEDDKEYNIKEGDNYYPENHNSKVNCDIAGNLHELFYKPTD